MKQEAHSWKEEREKRKTDVKEIFRQQKDEHDKQIEKKWLK